MGLTLSGGTLIADSVAEFSGTQGNDSWRYGYQEGAGSFDHSKFTEFKGGSGQGIWMHPVQHWTGDVNDASGLWDLAKSVAPWTMISRTASHPQGIIEGSIAIPHIVSRRWTAKADSQVGLTGFFHNTSANGDGTNGRIYLNGAQVYQCHTDGIRQDFNLLLDIKTGDLLDFVVDVGNANDTGSDTTNFAVSIWQDPVAAVAPFPSVRFLRGQVLSRVDGLGISGTPQLSFFVVTNPTANGRILHTGENKGTAGKSIAFLPDSSIRYNNGNKIFGDDTLYNAWNVGSYFVDTSKGYADGEFLKNGEPAIETSGVTATIQVDLPETGNETRAALPAGGSARFFFSGLD